MTRPNLNKLLRKWQRILRLQDWDIEIGYAHGCDLPENAQAATLCTYDLNRAQIRLLYPEEGYPQPDCQPYDVEQIVVHELLHVQFPAIINDENRSRVEHGTDKTAWTLVKLERGEI